MICITWFEFLRLIDYEFNKSGQHIIFFNRDNVNNCNYTHNQNSGQKLKSATVVTIIQ